MSKNNVAIQLTGDLEEFAVKQVNAFAADFQKAKSGINNMSKHLLDIAKRAEKDGGKERKVELYKAICRHGETVYKQNHLKNGEEQPIKKLLPFWPVAKSQILAAMTAGVVMAECKTVFEAVDKTPKQERGTKARDDKAEGDDDDGQVSIPKGAHGDALQESLTRVHKVLKAIVVQKPQLVAAAAVELGKLADALEEMAQLDEEADAHGASDVGVAGVPGESRATA